MDDNEQVGSLPVNELARPRLTIDPRLMEQITINPDVSDGRPGIRDLGVRVADVVSDLAFGESTEDVLARYPGLEDTGFDAARAYAEARTHWKWP